MSDPHAADWLYLQIFIQKAGVRLERDALIGLGDELITPHVREWVGHCRARGWCDRFFFLRFGSGGGYHLRLRLRGRPDDLERSVRPYVESRVVDFFDARAAALGMPGARLSAADLWRTERLRQEVYEPEYAKYGGAVGVALAEEHFEVSSEVTFDVIEAERASAVRRAQFALELARVLIGAFSDSPREQAFILKTYTHYWLPPERLRDTPATAQTLEANYARQRADLSRRFESDGPGALERAWQAKPHNPFPRWRAHLSEHVEHFKAAEASGRLRSAQFDEGGEWRVPLSEVPGVAGAPITSLLVITNYLHMLCNRLALPPLYEAQLTYLLYRHLEERFGFTSGLYPVRLEPEA